MQEPSVMEIARAILDYLKRNPEAQDTLEGIVQWWLPEQQNKPRTAIIKEALDKLVVAGLIAEHRGKDAQISYRVTPQRLRNPDQTSEHHQPGAESQRLKEGV
jgi:hypothetical protein